MEPYVEACFEDPYQRFFIFLFFQFPFWQPFQTFLLSEAQILLQSKAQILLLSKPQNYVLSQLWKLRDRERQVPLRVLKGSRGSG